MPGRLKSFGAFLLVACFVLPMTSCTEYLDASGKRVSVEPGEIPGPGVRKVVTHYYLLEELRAADPLSWLRVGAFAMPAALLIHSRKRPVSRATGVLWFLEWMPLAGVLFSLWYMAFLFRDLYFGGYVAAAAVALYLCGWIGEAYLRVKRRLKHSDERESLN